MTLSHSTFRWAVAGAVVAAALFGAAAANARTDVGISLGFASPGIAVGVGGPQYYAPPPQYYQPPPPVYYQPPPPVYYRPAPIYYAPPPPVYYGPPRGYYRPAPGYYRDGRDGYDRRDRDRDRDRGGRGDRRDWR